MSKKVVWGEGKYTSSQKSGTYGSFNEFLAKADRVRIEQEEATSYLQKALPAMTKLLEIRMTNRDPITVMRPLRYQTTKMQSELNKSGPDADLDSSFYGGITAGTENELEKAKNAKFVDVVETVNPGTILFLKSLDPNLREFIFEDGIGREHAISYDEKNALMTQTDIFETVKGLLERRGE